jgi:hypothetical protein
MQTGGYRTCTWFILWFLCPWYRVVLPTAIPGNRHYPPHSKVRNVHFPDFAEPSELSVQVVVSYHRRTRRDHHVIFRTVLVIRSRTRRVQVLVTRYLVLGDQRLELQRALSGVFRVSPNPARMDFHFRGRTDRRTGASKSCLQGICQGQGGYRWLVYLYLVTLNRGNNPNASFLPIDGCYRGSISIILTWYSCTMDNLVHLELAL